ncbi:HNH endonuclease [Coleofasciculus sp. FACHB-1120]|uniref:HNH endonuclease n=1 Tax=Coleofasciculus sp. FACHB-1120 TaxID=2692783 RepID=UPI0016890EAC|nr:HNH endonuclease [Coleofasciculus sp. FACHB-1120]MBD2741989.1 HNH endonuclease [Coleofasciculus sp. FACHB-1120]
MLTRIFLCNKKEWNKENCYKDIEDEINQAQEKISSGEVHRSHWSVGKIDKIQVGEKAYFKRVGSKPHGFFARGHIINAEEQYQLKLKLDNKYYQEVSEAYTDIYSNVSKDLRVCYEWDSVVGYNNPLDVDILKKEDKFSKAFFDYRNSGCKFKEEYIEALDYFWETHVEKYGVKVKFVDNKVIQEVAAAQERAENDGSFNPESIKDARERAFVSIVRRRGQSEFRISLLKAYNYRCAITGCNAEQALEAAHIKPYNDTQTNDPSNGLLLRADIHTLFDLKLIAIDPETMRVYLEPSLRNTYYAELHEKLLQLPKNINKNALQWRCEQCGWYR